MTSRSLYRANMDTPGGGTPSAARELLWQRLLDGRLTRISVACSIESTEVYKRFIPHSLGLERVWPYAHEQDRKTGAWRTPAQMNRIAQDLAAQDGWISGSGWPTWDSYFIENADAVLIFQSPGRAWRIRLAAVRSSSVSTVSGAVRALLRRQPRYGRGNGESFVERRIRGPRRGYYSQAGQHALENFPDKTFIIWRARDLRKLRAL